MLRSHASRLAVQCAAMSSPPAEAGIFCKTFCPCAVVYAHSGPKQPDLCASTVCCCVYTLFLWEPEGPRVLTDPSLCCRCL